MASGILKSITNTGLDSELRCAFIAPLTVLSNQPSYSQDTLNLRRPSNSQGVQRWEVMANMAPSVGDPGMLLHTTIYGHYKKFYIRMPQVALLKTTTSAVTVNGVTQAGSDTLDINGAMALVEGEYINIGNDPKVYLVIESGAAGVGVKVFPKLHQTVPDLAIIKTGAKVTMEVCFDTDTQLGITYVDGVLSDPGSVKLIEVLA